MDATLISIKNASGTRGPGLVHSVRVTAGSVSDVVHANALLHGEETDAFGDVVPLEPTSGLAPEAT